MNNKNIFSIQVLRGIASLMVVSFHSSREIRDIFGAGFLAWGEYGVDIFFVISGFVMMHSATYSKNRSALMFYQERMVRIVPMYWLMTLLMVFALLISPNAFNTAKIDYSHVIASFLFLPYFHPAISGSVMPLFVPGWTLMYEMYFYLIFGLFFYYFNRRSILLIAASIISVWTFFKFCYIDSAAAMFFGNSIVFEFIFGTIVSFSVSKKIITKNISIIFAGISFFLVVYFAEVGNRLMTAGLFSALLVYFSIPFDGFGCKIFNKMLIMLGDSSYSIYLSHIFVIGVVGVIWKLVGLKGEGGVISSIIYLLFCIVASIVVGIFMYKYIEKPTTSFIRNFLKKC